MSSNILCVFLAHAKFHRKSITVSLIVRYRSLFIIDLGGCGLKLLLKMYCVIRV
jgi:hypothetical protein